MYFYFLNLAVTFFQSSGLNFLIEKRTIAEIIISGINTSIIYSYEGEGGNWGNGATGGSPTGVNKAWNSGTVVQALIATTCCW